MTEAKTEVPSSCIVAATDFSPDSERALAWAAHLAVLRDAKLRLIHATDWGEPPDRMFDFARTSTARDLRSAARRRLKKLAQALRERIRLVTYDAETGTPARVILKEAEDQEADLVVLGTRGLRGWPHALLGSTAERVIAGAACPVLAVHGNDPLPPERPWRLLAATDGSTDAELAIRIAVRLLGPTAGEIVLLHAFVPPPVLYSGIGGFRTSRIIEHARLAAEEQLAKEARALAAEGIAASPLLRDGFPPQVIVDIATELHVDLVVLGTRGLGHIGHLLGSTAERVAQIAPVPVLVVPRRAAR